MTNWTNAQLDAAREGTDFYVAPFRDDGITPGTPTWIWSVAVDDRIFIRTGNPQSRWFAAAIQNKAGQITLAGNTIRVAFTLVTDDTLKDSVDAAYDDKYKDDPYFSPDVLPRSRDHIAEVSRTH